MAEENGSSAAILDALAAEIRRQADENCETFDYAAMQRIAPWSRRQTERLFRERFLTSPVRYFRDRQWECARKLLLDGEDVLSASVRAGFASPGRLHDANVARSGLTPGELRRHAAGVHIDFGFFQTQIGIVLLAATQRGLTLLRICGMNASAQDLADEIQDLWSLFPDADMIEQPEAIQNYADQLVAYLEDRTGAAFCPPLDILQGTTFQREVWAELQRIPPGQTLTYPNLAERMGRPEAVAEIEQAVHDNRLAIMIPCHRCLTADGLPYPHKWGTAWQDRLIALENERARHTA